MPLPKSFLPGRLGKVHRSLFQDIALLGDTLQFGLQSPHLVRPGVLRFTLDFGRVVPLCPHIDTVDTDTSRSATSANGWAIAVRGFEINPITMAHVVMA